MPGFDPARALTRPTGTWVHLRDVRVATLDAPDAVLGHHSSCHHFVTRWCSPVLRAYMFLKSQTEGWARGTDASDLWRYGDQFRVLHGHGVSGGPTRSVSRPV
jgi:hypothetical protein